MLLWEGYRRHIRRHTGPEFKAVPCLHPDRQTDRKTLFCLLSVFAPEGSQPSVLYGRALPTAF